MKIINYTVNTRGFDETFKTASFDTKADAISKIREIEEDIYSRPYYLNHGEYARPEFKAQRYKDGWGIKVFYHYLNGTCHAPKDGRLTFEDRLSRFGKYFE